MIRTAFILAEVEDWVDNVEELELNDDGAFESTVGGTLSPNNFLPTLEFNDEEGEGLVLDQHMAMFRFVCQRHDLYPTDPMERFKVEETTSLVLSDCAFLNPAQPVFDLASGGTKFSAEFFAQSEKEQQAWAKKRAVEVFPESLKKINKQIEENFARTKEFAVGDALSMADVAILTYLHAYVVGNKILGKKTGEKYLKKQKTLMKYWKKHRGKLTDYITYDRKEYLF